MMFWVFSRRSCKMLWQISALCTLPMENMHCRSAPDNMRICVKYACKNSKYSLTESLRSNITHKKTIKIPIKVKKKHKMIRLFYFVREHSAELCDLSVRKKWSMKLSCCCMKNTHCLFFHHISLFITHFNEWNTPQTKKLSGALLSEGAWADRINIVPRLGIGYNKC